MLSWPTGFIQTLDNMWLDAKMVWLYKHFVLCESIILSMYWREACVMQNNKKEAEGTWKDRDFAPIMKECKLESIQENSCYPGCLLHLSLLWDKVAGQYDPNGFQLSGFAWRFSSSCMTTSRLILNGWMEKGRTPSFFQFLLCWPAQHVCPATNIG